MTKQRDKWQFGDFQTPTDLATMATELLTNLGFQPRSIIEPTCGKGTFLFAAASAFPTFERAIGLEINHEYASKALEIKQNMLDGQRVEIFEHDFFTFSWENVLERLAEPILIIGNPPWVTNSELGLLNSTNLPEKSNFQNLKGFDAITGKSNFDISEWMLLKYLDWLQSRSGIIAILCKTAVARKVLLQAWRSNFSISSAKMFKVDSMKFFKASVDACFLVIEKTITTTSPQECLVYAGVDTKAEYQRFGYHDGLLISDIELFEKHKEIRGKDNAYNWRSGIKHDCSKIMELDKVDGVYINGLNEVVDIEDDYVYPMLKSSDVANGQIRYGRKFMIVTQTLVGQDTTHIQNDAPKTWDYLSKHSKLFDARASSIYKDRPSFSIFGVGPYSFSPYKVAISGFYKNSNFKLIDQFEGKSVVLDDTGYFLPCWSKEEAIFLIKILNSQSCQEFLSSMIFWEEKRPITVEVLKRLCIKHLADKEMEAESYSFFAQNQILRSLKKKPNQPELFQQFNTII